MNKMNLQQVNTYNICHCHYIITAVDLVLFCFSVGYSYASKEERKAYGNMLLQSHSGEDLQNNTAIEAHTSMSSTLHWLVVMQSLAKAIATQMSQLPVNLKYP